jgi:hypothetical protein
MEYDTQIDKIKKEIVSLERQKQDLHLQLASLQSEKLRVDAERNRFDGWQDTRFDFCSTSYVQNADLKWIVILYGITVNGMYVTNREESCVRTVVDIVINFHMLWKRVLFFNQRFVLLAVNEDTRSLNVKCLLAICSRNDKLL